MAILLVHGAVLGHIDEVEKRQFAPQALGLYRVMDEKAALCAIKSGATHHLPAATYVQVQAQGELIALV